MRVEKYPEDWPAEEAGRRYEKGENRRKHAGRDSVAGVVWDPDRGEWVGKCPRGFSGQKAEQLVRRAIPEYSARSADRPRALWTYFEGAVYMARTSDGGTTWHGFPSQDPPREIRDRLEALARTRGEEQALKKFLDRRLVRK